MLLLLLLPADNRRLEEGNQTNGNEVKQSDRNSKPHLMDKQEDTHEYNVLHVNKRWMCVTHRWCVDVSIVTVIWSPSSVASCKRVGNHTHEMVRQVGET